MIESRTRVIDDLLCFDLYAASRAMTALYRPLLGPLDLTYPQYLVLQVLHRRTSAGIGELNEVLRLDYGTLTPLLRRLEQRGLIARTRDADDLRAVAVALTDAGRALGPALDRVRERIGETVGLDASSLATLQATLRDLTERIDGR
ncbi:DNA-binding MarR family transcriptional regulator [Friedmanniella endophytica]|uniref:DNA-binding MarR family transcriptional regulator n=1 Tax=Microlunatus kandeliicorticis TaxID=1759536 RepID=A0A7W3P431_9ACTN|nr:MarR family transcriptional regulator [Microlunatus kandeliicorticis]MBA8792448.1 DNA-binding MarR family transcriptional regulator [Microlunatus kandeliicorticis]